MRQTLHLDWFNLDRLIAGSVLTDQRKRYIERRLIQLDGSDNEFMALEYEGIVKELRDNQMCPIENAKNYNQTDIIRKLREKCQE